MTIIDLNINQTIYTGPYNIFVKEMLTSYFRVKYRSVLANLILLEDRKGAVAIADHEGYGTIIQFLSDAGRPAGKLLMIKLIKQITSEV